MPAGDHRRILIAGVCVAAAYVVAARLGFLAAFAAEQITTVWAPTGIAVAALLHWGRRLWPAIWLAAFAVNAESQAPLWTAAIIATGNTLEAVAAASLLGRAHGFDPALRRVADTARFIVVAAILATVVSATIGVTTLCLAGVQPWSRFSGLWSAWWLGDALGAIVVAPVLLTTFRTARHRWVQDWIGASLLILTAVIVTELVFGEILGPIFGHGPLHYVVFPFVVIAAFRFGQPAAAVLVFGVSVVTIWHTVRGTGPFASQDIYQGLILLQVFTGVLASTGLLLAAAMTERQTSQRRRGAAHAVGEVLVDAPDVADAAPAILRNVCENLEWQVGAFWLIDDEARKLRCVAVWNNGTTPMTAFEEVTMGTVFESAVGLPGRVWATGSAVWIEDVQQDGNFPRAPAARSVGLHGGFAFPIRLGRDVLGVIEFFTDRVATPDAELLDTMSTVGNQVGQFMGRKRVEHERDRAAETLRASEERLRDADRRKDEFLAMLAHELRNPLAPIRTGLELVRIAGDAPGTVERLRPMMERQVGHMVRLIDDLLDVSRITSGKIYLQKRSAALEDLVNGAVEANRAAIDAAGVCLTVQLADPQMLLSVDPTRFVQVLSNLLHNAAKFTDEGGQIVVSSAVVDQGVVGRELVLSVSDTGIGISSELLPRVFDLFSQGDRSMRRPQPGLGIGLALARRIVEMHGGRIEARSGGPGCGSEFTIHLPLVHGVENLRGDAAVPVFPGAGVRRQVLIVDDNADAADTLASLVRALGGEARTAADGGSAIQCALEFSPDVILLDIGMPGLDGYETCRRIRQQTVGKRPFIVALTGWGQDGDKRRAAEAGFDAHLTKPTDPEVLQQLLTKASHERLS